MVEERKQALVRIPVELYERLRVEAEAGDRSLNSQIVRALRAWAACQAKHPSESP